MALDASFAPWAAAAEAKERNRKTMMDSIQGIGQSFANVGDLIKDKQQKNQWQKTINSMMQNPNISPQMKAMLPVIAQRPDLMGQLGPSMMKAQKSTVGGPGKRVVYQNPDGSVSLSFVEGSTPLEVSDAQAMQYTAVPKSAKSKNEATGARAEAMQRGIDVKQIDQLIAKTGLTPKQQTVLQMNNQRSARAMQILSQPNITWQELALGEIDLTGIMQGGVPQRDEIIATHFPGWQQNVAHWKTYATGHPTQNVPPDIKNKVKELVNGVVRVDNRILSANAKFAKNMIGPTIRGGLKPNQTNSIDEMTNVLTNTGSTDNPASQGGWGIQKVQ